MEVLKWFQSLLLLVLSFNVKANRIIENRPYKFQSLLLLVLSFNFANNVEIKGNKIIVRFQSLLLLVLSFNIRS